MSRFHVALLLCLALSPTPASADTATELKKIDRRDNNDLVWTRVAQ